ncbi:MAG TPA: hypothetical protein VLI72_16165 [Methylibium sp.]|nr:hypothetical protein [Methylibium sp.]
MSRQVVRELKRAVQAAARPGACTGSVVLARDSALSLLARSIGFGHGRLAVIRLGMAVHAGAEVPAEHWTYCRTAADDSRDPSLQALFLAAAQAAHARPAAAPPQTH